MAMVKDNEGFAKTHKVLLEELDRPVGVGRKKRQGAGRPVKVRGETVAVILHLYKDQVRWLDDYARWVEGLAEGNAKLSRVEIVRGLLLGLAEFTVKSEATLAEGTSITSERNLQRAVVAALAGRKKRSGK
ncbi:MAG: hypothetical protein FWD53_06970 [Phycisphaerales bacterium]|nr:hypothetical protein [Phycisphaerales bacterium]